MAQYANNCHASLRTCVQYLEFMLIKENRAWWHAPIKEALERQKQEDCCASLTTLLSLLSELLSRRDTLKKQGMGSTVYSGIHMRMRGQKHTHPPIHMHTNDPTYT